MTSIARRDVFQGIADPVRREITQLVAQHEMNIIVITGHLNISRPSVSQHVKILYECGLMQTEKRGRDCYCTIQSQNLKEVARWIEQYRKLWEEKLDSFEQYLIQLHAKK